MFYLFTPEFGLFFLALLIGWIAVNAVRSSAGAASSIFSDGKDSILEIRVCHGKSASGRSRVVCAYKKRDQEVYTAKVICPELRRSEWVLAFSMKELEEKVESLHQKNDLDSQQR